MLATLSRYEDPAARVTAVAVTALSDLLNAAREGFGWSASRVAREAQALGYDVSTATATAYCGGRHPAHPTDETLEAFAATLRLPVGRVREAAGLSRDPGLEYVPPAAARKLSTQQRRAVDQIIRAMVGEDVPVRGGGVTFEEPSVSRPMPLPRSGQVPSRGHDSNR